MDAMDQEGRDKMMEQCDAAVALFQSVDARMNIVVRRYSEATGTAPAVFNGRLVASYADLLLRDTKSERDCGRCHLPMEIKASGGRPYFQCPNCNAVALV